MTSFCASVHEAHSQSSIRGRVGSVPKTLLCNGVPVRIQRYLLFRWMHALDAGVLR